LAVVASRSSLFGALLRTALPNHRHAVFHFLRGLSRDELECLAEFEGAMAMETWEFPGISPYEILMEFFADWGCRTNNEDDLAHKTCVVLSWLECAGTLGRIRARKL